MPSTSNNHTLDSLYREHQSWLIKRLRARLSCSQQAADFAQDTFLRILSSPDCNQRVAAVREPRSYLDNAENTTRVNVYQHSVEVTAQDGTRRNCNAGHRLDFTDRQISPAVRGAENDAWVRRQLVINDMRLDDFVRELGRYRTGLLRCDPTVAHFRISGAFRTGDTDQALRAIEKSFPVKVTYRTRYWAHISR